MRNAARIVEIAFAAIAGANGGELLFAPSAQAAATLVTVAKPTSPQNTTSVTAERSRRHSPGTSEYNCLVRPPGDSPCNCPPNSVSYSTLSGRTQHYHVVCRRVRRYGPGDVCRVHDPCHHRNVWGHTTQHFTAGIDELLGGSRVVAARSIDRADVHVGVVVTSRHCAGDTRRCRDVSTAHNREQHRFDTVRLPATPFVVEVTGRSCDEAIDGSAEYHVPQPRSVLPADDKRRGIGLRNRIEETARDGAGGDDYSFDRHVGRDGQLVKESVAFDSVVIVDHLVREDTEGSVTHD